MVYKGSKVHRNKERTTAQSWYKVFKCAKDLWVYFVNRETIKSNLFDQALYMIRYITWHEWKTEGVHSRRWNTLWWCIIIETLKNFPNRISLWPIGWYSKLLIFYKKYKYSCNIYPGYANRLKNILSIASFLSSQTLVHNIRRVEKILILC